MLSIQVSPGRPNTSLRGSSRIEARNTQSPIPLGILGRLSPEIRLKLYNPLLDGTEISVANINAFVQRQPLPNILNVSKVVRADASTSLYSVGIFIFDFTARQIADSSTNNHQDSVFDISQIQQARMFLTLRHYQKKVLDLQSKVLHHLVIGDALSPFDDLDKPKKRCIIILHDDLSAHSQEEVYQQFECTHRTFTSQLLCEAGAIRQHGKKFLDCFVMDLLLKFQSFHELSFRHVIPVVYKTRRGRSKIFLSESMGKTHQTLMYHGLRRKLQRAQFGAPTLRNWFPRRRRNIPGNPMDGEFVRWRMDFAPVKHRKDQEIKEAWTKKERERLLLTDRAAKKEANKEAETPQNEINQ